MTRKTFFVAGVCFHVVSGVAYLLFQSICYLFSHGGKVNTKVLIKQVRVSEKILTKYCA